MKAGQPSDTTSRTHPSSLIPRDLIDYVARTIVERFQPERIILFGSHARGDAGPDSDLDLFVEMESDLRPPERAILIDAAFSHRRWPMDVLVYTPEEVGRLRHVNGALLQTIEKEGKLLYERSRVQLSGVDS